MRTEATFPTPYGVGTVLVEDDRLVEVRLPVVRSTDGSTAADTPSGDAQRGGRRDAAMSGRDSQVVPSTVAAERPEGAALRWARELAAYFSGGRTGWTEAEVDLDSRGFTHFRTAVYRALLDVPAGQVVTYGELARRAGRPAAARAVGSAMAENPIAIVVPCHRVVRADGSLGRYGFGDPWKRFLLLSEGALLGDDPETFSDEAGPGTGTR